MTKAILSVFIIMMSNVVAAGHDWRADVLGDGFETTVVEMPDDYSGRVVCSVTRKLPASRDGVGVLYVHGYNDYFFQAEMADRFVSAGYDFYAVDLRKYGRSLRAGQRAFEARDLSEYYADIDAAVGIMLSEGCSEVALMGHSTGGLILSCYMADGAGDKYPIIALMLNSPFLDMNQSGFNEKIAIPLISWLSGLFPDIEISQGSSNAYAQSIMSKYHGEWDYNTEWKLEVSPDVTSGWLGAIHRAQKRIQRGASIGCPILLMHSDKSVGGEKWYPGFNSGDSVLDVEEISRYGRRLGRDVTELTVRDGMHDLFLSRKGVREALYKRVIGWLDSKAR